MPPGVARRLPHPGQFRRRIGHLWFVYMLLGLYLFAVVSPWIETASRRHGGYLALWAFTLCIPYVHLVSRSCSANVLERHADALLFSGFLGYMVLAAYLRRYRRRAWHKWGGALLVVAGYFATAWIFDARLATRSGSSRTSNFVGLRDDQRGRDVGRAVPAAERRQAGWGRFTGVVTDIRDSATAST